jgi:metal-sulfur cluster biosynthetic enzyme
MPLTETDVRATLSKIVDPEIHIDIVSLGLVYGIDLQPAEQGRMKVGVKTTLTTPACPYGPALLSKIHADLAAMPQVSDVEVDLVWVPPWDPKTMASPEARLKMGFLEFEDLEELEEEKSSSEVKP